SSIASAKTSSVSPPMSVSRWTSIICMLARHQASRERGNRRLGRSTCGRLMCDRTGMETLKDKAAIVGVGHTEYSRDSGRRERSLAWEAISKAVADAGLKPSDIDGIAKFSMDNNDHVHLAANLGIKALRFFADAPWGGGGGPVGTILLGAMAVATG